YVNLLRLTRGVIRQMQPEAIVLGGSLAGGDVKFLSEMYAAGAKGNFDGLALHPYSLPRAPDDYSDCRWSFSCAIDSIRSMMEAQGDAKPVYLTEFGWS